MSQCVDWPTRMAASPQKQRATERQVRVCGPSAAQKEGTGAAQQWPEGSGLARLRRRWKCRVANLREGDYGTNECILPEGLDPNLREGDIQEHERLNAHTHWRLCPHPHPALSRKIDDSVYESRDLSIPRKKLEDVLRDAQVWVVLFFLGGCHWTVQFRESGVCIRVCVVRKSHEQCNMTYRHRHTSCMSTGAPLACPRSCSSTAANVPVKRVHPTPHP